MQQRNGLKLAVAGMLAAVAGGILAKGPAAETDLETALAKAEAGKKLLFVQYGREACGNCKALKEMIRTGQVRLPESDFAYADLNCDDSAARQAFGARFKVEGNMLPFVVIADPAGKQLAARAGYGSNAEYGALIKEARRAYAKERKAQAAPPRAAAGPLLRPADIPPDANRAMRTWTAASDGAQTTAAVVSTRAGFVMLKKADGSKVQVPATALSKADQDYLDQLRQNGAEPQAEAPGNTP